MKALLAIALLVGLCGSSYAEPVDFERLATAIYHAEGGAKTIHPYGIMARYKHTTPRQACLNTIKRAYRDWQALPSGHGIAFIDFLQRRYAPSEGKTLRPAERALNRFWSKNVLYFYKGAI